MSALIGAVTALGRPEYELLIQAAQSLSPLRGVSRGALNGVEWAVCLDGLDDRDGKHSRRVCDIARQAGVPVSVVSNTGHPGPGPARNVALNSIHAPWLLTLDSDDTIRPEGMVALLAAIERTPGARWGAGRCPHVDADGSQVWAGPPDYFQPGAIEVSDSFWAAKLKLGGLPFLCTATIAATAAVRSVGGWPDTPRQRAEDTCLWAVLTSKYRGVWLPEVVYWYRRHPASVTHQLGFRELDEDLPEIATMVAAGSTRVTH